MNMMNEIAPAVKALTQDAGDEDVNLDIDTEQADNGEKEKSECARFYMVVCDTYHVTIQSLKVAQEKNPSGRWWIKGDAFDIREGLRESLKNEWSGDCDLDLNKGLQVISEFLIKDNQMLKAGHEKSKEMYEKKRSGNGQEATLFSLAWDVLGYETLLKENVEFQNKIAGMQLLIQNSTINISAKLHQLTREITSYSKGVYAKQRMAATHIFVFMISEEQRNQKPYAIPVRFFSYHSVTDKRIGELKKEIVEAMKKLQMLPIVTQPHCNMHVHWAYGTLRNETKRNL
ncbi:hypothetical protein AC249_AIPGENE6161 [Exaiptasia diaphana]|nr:hypothetical protein AC249_AIPGENE6161 [Exaiptasia diaphana]